MSFGWSAGDVVAGVQLFVKIGKALKDSGGSKSEYQDTVEFMESVSSVIAGMQKIRDDDPQLEWGQDLITQSNIVMSAIKSFKDKTHIDKYKKSLGTSSQRSKVKTIGREIQFELSSVKKFQKDLSQPLVVLNNLLSLETLSSIAKLSQELSQSLPGITKGLDTLNQDTTTQLGGIASHQQQAEINIRDDLKTLQMLLTHVQDNQVVIKGLSQSNLMTQSQQQIQLQNIVESIGSFSQTQQVIQREAEALQQHINNGGGEGYVSTALKTTLQFVGNGIAGAIGGMIVLRGSRASECQKEHSDRESETPRRHDKTGVRDAINKEVSGAIVSQVHENEQIGEFVQSDKYTQSDKRTNTERESTSELSLDWQATSHYISTNQGTASSDNQSTVQSTHTDQKSTFFDSLINNLAISQPAHKIESNTSVKAIDASHADLGLMSGNQRSTSDKGPKDSKTKPNSEADTASRTRSWECCECGMSGGVFGINMLETINCHECGHLRCGCCAEIESIEVKANTSVSSSKPVSRPVSKPVSKPASSYNRGSSSKPVSRPPSSYSPAPSYNPVSKTVSPKPDSKPDSNSQGYWWSTPNRQRAELILSNPQANSERTDNKLQLKNGVPPSYSKVGRGDECNWVCCHCRASWNEIIVTICPICSHHRCEDCNPIDIDSSYRDGLSGRGPIIKK